MLLDQAPGIFRRMYLVLSEQVQLNKEHRFENIDKYFKQNHADVYNEQSVGVIRIKLRFICICRPDDGQRPAVYTYGTVTGRTSCNWQTFYASHFKFERMLEYYQYIPPSRYIVCTCITWVLIICMYYRLVYGSAKLHRCPGQVMWLSINLQ